jgi:hypothetical protein
MTVLVMTAVVTGAAQERDAGSGGVSPQVSAAPPAARLLTPVQGRPVFVAPGASFPVAAERRLTAAASDAGIRDVEAWLAPGRPAAGRRIGLTLAEASAPAGAAAQVLRLVVPPDTPSGTYDLDLRLGTEALHGRHCVAVGAVRESIRIVHLGDMLVGDAGAPEFDERLVEEVNLVSPTVIVATGDYLDSISGGIDAAWKRLSDYFSHFYAPAVMVCGDQDDVAAYSRWVAPSPIGETWVGPHRVLVLYDHRGSPIEADAEQVAWVERLTPELPGSGITIVASHDESPSLLRIWRQRDELTARVQAMRLGLWLAGGRRDWDGREHRALIDAAWPVLYVRSPSASTLTLGGGSGTSHYRVIDVDGRRAVIPGESADGRTPPPSITVGRLRVWHETKDGAAGARIVVTAVNHLSFRMDGLSTSVQVRGEEHSRPWCIGAELCDATFAAGVWDCRLSFGLPDRGALRATVGTGAAPVWPDVRVRINAPMVLAVESIEDGTGSRVAEEGVSGARIIVENRGVTEAAFMLTARLDGEVVPLARGHDGGRRDGSAEIALDGGASVAIGLELTGLPVRAGWRELQVYVMRPEAWLLTTQRVEVRGG